jgi:FRG domain-containing protein
MRLIRPEQINPARCFRARHFHTAAAFMAALHPLADDFWGPNFALWIYRGQSDSQWPLLPSALRATAWERFRLRRAPHDPASTTEDNRRLRESVLLSDFFSGLDDIGAEIPGDGMAMRRALRRHTNWPAEALLPFIAFAQHHGVPTRLLDWSTSSRVAAYFAAADAVRRQTMGRDIAVWALNRTFLDLNRTEPPFPAIRLVHAARASNPHLHAQDGLFTLCRRHDGTEPLEQTLRKMLTGQTLVRRKLVELPPRGFVLQKLTLPQTEAAALLERLAYEDVTAARLFPTPEGVIWRLIERDSWRHLPRINPLRPDD